MLLVALFMGMAGIGTYVALTLLIKGEKPVIVPDLVGKDVLVGLERLSDLGLNTRVKGIRYDDRVPRHYVIEQDPEPGSTIKRGRDVKIKVSRGPESVIMPNLHGLSLQQAGIVLVENGLCQAVVSRMHNPIYASGQVMAHDPPAGVLANRKQCVNLLVSKGARPMAFAMVDLKGLPLEAAVTALEQHQLKVGNIRAASVDGSPLDSIVNQTPAAGYRAFPGQLVELTVNRLPANSNGNARPSESDPQLFRFALENGFLNRRVEVKLSKPSTVLTLFDDFMRPGQEIWLFIPKGDNPTVLVYVDGELVDSRFMDGR